LPRTGPLKVLTMRESASLGPPPWLRLAPLNVTSCVHTIKATTVESNVSSFRAEELEGRESLIRVGRRQLHCTLFEPCSAFSFRFLSQCKDESSGAAENTRQRPAAILWSGTFTRRYPIPCTRLNKPYFGELMKPVNDKFLFFSVKYCFLLLLQFFFWSSLYGRFQIGVSQPIYAIKSSTCFSSCNQSINLINNLFVFQLIEIRKLKLMFINKPLVNPPLEHNGYTMRMHFSAYVLH